MKSLRTYINEKLIINKHNIHIDLNDILSTAWDKIEQKHRNLSCIQINVGEMFTEVAEIINEFGGLKTSDTVDVFDAQYSFKKCSDIYMFDVNGNNEFLNNLFNKMIQNDIELRQLVNADLFDIEYEDTDDFKILVIGSDRKCKVFIGKNNHSL